MKIAFVGASGYGNVGDDTYPVVFAQQLPEHELVIYNSDLPSSLPEDIGMVVLGGGGILYNNPKEGPEEAESPHFRCMKFYMDAAIARGIPWGMLSCGFQFQVHKEERYAHSLKPWVPYLQQASFITLRSRNCVRIAAEISGREDAAFFPDAAYLLQGKGAPPSAAAPTEIILVPAGLVNARNAVLTHQLRQFASASTPVAWLGMGAPVDDGPLLMEAEKLFPQTRIMPSPGVMGAFEAVARARFVITGRYHGMVFARIHRVPFITPMDAPYKIRMEAFDADMGEAARHFEVLRRFVR